MVQLILIALATFISEDLACISAGVLIAQGRIGFVEGSLACAAGIYAGDMLLYLTGRIARRSALRWPLVRLRLSAERLKQASDWLSAKGPVVILLSRFTPGLRLPTYLAAGLLRVGGWRSALILLFAAAVWTSALVGVGMIAGETAARSALGALGAGSLALVVASACYVLLRRALVYRERRRWTAFLGRKIRWEFWPPWAAYLPLVPYLLWLALRHRSLTLFTAANPGMPSGGFVGESKSQILRQVAKVEGVVPRFTVIEAGLTSDAKVNRADAFLAQHETEFPLVLKPDVGERGRGVVIAHSRAEVAQYLCAAAGNTILQEYVGGPEFGVFYCRRPSDVRGEILSVTEKRFPEVIGDGVSSFEELVLRDERACLLAATYFRQARRARNYVPARGEAVALTEVGAHSRGTVFLDGRSLRTPALETAIDRISRSHPGFYFGRFDVRAPSVEAFREARELRVIELNGVTGEPTHIYDPSVSLWAAYSAMFSHWRLAFEIGALNRQLGSKPLSLLSFLRLIWLHGRRHHPSAAVGARQPAPAAAQEEATIA